MPVRAVLQITNQDLTGQTRTGRQWAWPSRLCFIPPHCTPPPAMPWVGARADSTSLPTLLYSPPPDMPPPPCLTQHCPLPYPSHMLCLLYCSHVGCMQGGCGMTVAAANLPPASRTPTTYLPSRPTRNFAHPLPPHQHLPPLIHRVER